MKILAIVLVALLAACASTPKKTCQVTPSIFCEPFAELAATLPLSEQQRLLEMRADEYWRLHLGFGMGVRNRFDLWGDNELTAFFRENGVSHPDDMSVPFIGGFVEYLRGGPVDVENAIRIYRLPPPPPAVAPRIAA